MVLTCRVSLARYKNHLAYYFIGYFPVKINSSCMLTILHLLINLVISLSIRTQPMERQVAVWIALIFFFFFLSRSWKCSIQAQNESQLSFPTQWLVAQESLLSPFSLVHLLSSLPSAKPVTARTIFMIIMVSVGDDGKMWSKKLDKSTTGS